MNHGAATERIVHHLSSHLSASSTELAEMLGLSRQAAHSHLKKMLAQGRVQREGAGRATRYRLVDQGWRRNFPIKDLDEDRVYEALRSEFPKVGVLEGDTADVVAYLVTEMLNNAIDHSSGQEVRISVDARGDRLFFEFEDDGIGVFAHVQKEFGLEGEKEALAAISKGKTTTAPKEHTGEGIFFTSKISHIFRLESGSLAWIVDNERDDMALEFLHAPRIGTRVAIELELSRVPNLTAVFDEYTEDYEFNKTRIVIELFAIKDRFISRSEAKRLLNGLDKFRSIVLDFSGVRSVGQGFVDQVFRVWAKAHPDVELHPENMNEAVAFMVTRGLPQKP